MIKPAVFGTGTCWAPHDDDDDGDADDNSDDDGYDDPERAPMEAPSQKEVLLSKERGRSQLSQTFNHVVRFHLVTTGQQNKQSSNKVGIGKMNFDGKLIKLNVIAITTLCLLYEVYIVIICIANSIGGKKTILPYQGTFDRLQALKRETI